MRYVVRHGVGDECAAIMGVQRCGVSEKMSVVVYTTSEGMMHMGGREWVREVLGSELAEAVLNN